MTVLRWDFEGFPSLRRGDKRGESPKLATPPSTEHPTVKTGRALPACGAFERR